MMGHHLETGAVGSALRMVYRPARMVRDAFDFLNDTKPGDDDRGFATTQTLDAIGSMEAAADQLKAVAETVMAANAPTARQVLELTTDEAARFDA